MAELDPHLRELMDKQELHEVLMRYCRGVDRVDAELLATVFHPDAWDDHGLFKGTSQEFIEWVIPFQHQFERSLHVIMNELFEVDGDVAYGESYFGTYYTTFPTDAAPALLIKSTGRYVDRFERRDGRWRIADRRLILETDEVAPVGGGDGGDVREGFDRGVFVQGATDRSDPSYERLPATARP